jgi:hypothetical protein
LDPIFEEMPAPVRPDLSSEARYRRNRRFAAVLNAFVLVYSLIHKFLLPVYLRYVARSSSFAPLDAWWVYHVVLAALLSRKEWDDLWLRAALFFGVGGAACQILVSFRERNWHSVSLWVTSAATLWVVFFLLSKTRWRFPGASRGLKSSWKVLATATGFLVQFALFGFTFTVQRAAREAAVRATPAETWPVLTDPGICGAGGFRLPWENGAPRMPRTPALRDIAVRDCGFPAALASFDPSAGLTLENRTSRYLNVKAYVPSQGRWRPLQNIPLPAGLSHAIAPDLLAGKDVLLLASDADPKKGILLLVASPAALAAAVAPGDASPSFVQVDRSGLSRIR